MPEYPPLAITIIIIALTVYCAALQFKIGRLNSRIEKPPPPAPPQPSQELSDFLNDTKTGYSFVRVAPSDVIIRSPRG